MASSAKTSRKEIKDYLPDVYTEYAMSVISDRAIPDIRDGLKPVQRRILYSMWQQGLSTDEPHKKSARTVGEVLGKYHPHGDQAVYDALVRLGQDFTMRHPLVDGQGNFGSIDGDPAAAMRYTEARLTELAEEFFTRLKPDGSGVNWIDNFDGSTEEPEVLPVPFPNLLVNGTSGIAVGMSTDIPPHNLHEVLEASIHLIQLENPKQAQWDTLFDRINGPDFPTGGIIFAEENELKELYKTGNGQFEIAGRCHKEDISPKRKAVVIEELPYSVSKSKLIDEIVDLAKSDEDPGISTVRDESDRDGLRVVVECRLGRSYDVVLNNLYENTSLMKRQRCSFLALNDGVPEELDLKTLLIRYNEFMDEVLVRNTTRRKERAEERLHIVRGLIKALVDIDRVIEIVKQSETGPKASEALQHEFDMSERQSEAVLDRRIRSLTGMNQIEIEQEKENLLNDIEKYEKWLNSKNERSKIIKGWFQEIQDTYAEPRSAEDADSKHTTIRHETFEIEMEDLEESQPTTLSIYPDGYIRRDHGKKEISELTEPPQRFIKTDTLEKLFVFGRDGSVYSFRVSEIPKDARNKKGNPFQQINPNIEAPVGIIPESETNVVVLTRMGYIKILSMDDDDTFDDIYKSGIKYTKLEDDDEVIDVFRYRSDTDVAVISEDGKGIRFLADDMRVLSRNARGVIAKKGEPVAGGACIKDDEYLLIKGTSTQAAVRSSEIAPQRRGGKGKYWVKPPNGETINELFVSTDPEAVKDGGIIEFDSRSKLGGRGARDEIDYFLLRETWRNTDSDE